MVSFKDEKIDVTEAGPEQAAVPVEENANTYREDNVLTATDEETDLCIEPLIEPADFYEEIEGEPENVLEDKKCLATGGGKGDLWCPGGIINGTYVKCLIKECPNCSQYF